MSYDLEVFVAPSDLSDDAVARAVATHWSIVGDSLEYTPVGFGSHHWTLTDSGTSWFVTCDDLRMGARDGGVLRDALSAAHSLRMHGLDFVVAPLLSNDGDVVVTVAEHYRLAVYPFIEGLTSTFGPYETSAAAANVVHRLAAIHAATPIVRSSAPADDFVVAGRAALSAAMGDLDTPWTSGPYAERARQQLRRHERLVLSALDVYDDLVESVSDQAMVVTHGEPHRANTIVTERGPQLIDWETLRLAPPERDLWSLVDQQPDARLRYERSTGKVLTDSSLSLYRLRWDLTEIALYAHDFRSPHRETDDTATAWRGFADAFESLTTQLDH